MSTKPDPVSEATKQQLREKLDEFIKAEAFVTDLSAKVQRLGAQLETAAEHRRDLEVSIRDLLWDVTKHGGSSHVMYAGKMFTRREACRDHNAGVDVEEAPHNLGESNAQTE